MITSQSIRKKYLEFFEAKGHDVQKSAPMVIKNDPTLMFTNAGMNQFKDIFLGNKVAKDNRVVNTQKCLRVSGKHNDLEEVGVDTYHHTMFEMLGNWSFGDYFKKEAINWAWELLVDVYGIDKNKLYVTIFEGNKEDGLGEDIESYNIWKEIISEDRILKCDKKDNFWEMGEVGPCGPCSEIHVDLRSAEEIAKVPGKDLVNKDHPQVIEVWNLVFMQYNRFSDGSLHELPAKHVDTGMGFERLAMVLQNKTSNYDTDVFKPLIDYVAKISHKEYLSEGEVSKEQEKINIAIRVIVDHIRAISFSIADGQLPSNNGAGYVIRRILRRAVRYGYQVLNLKDAFLYKLVEVLSHQMGGQFPELMAQTQLIEKVIKEEETSFYRTLETGIKRLESLLEDSNEKTIKGEDVFELYDTYGFPFDLTALICQEKGVEVDEEGFKRELQKQKNRSRQASKSETSDWIVLMEDDKEEFIGYDVLTADVRITRYREVVQKKKKLYQLVFNYTPFYAEGGGQVGDTGFIQSEKEKIYIVDTKKENELIIHLAEELPEMPQLPFHASVNKNKRELTACNHTATHLMHHALREVLGEHVEQRGSLVNEKHLRFDFSHFSKVTEEELTKVENLVNQSIRSDIRLNELRNTPLSKAKEMGAMALFGEKYGDVVRVIQFGESVELCGGTHVESTGKVGLFKITSESSIASGIRRIEAITSVEADKFIVNKLHLVDRISELLKNPKNIEKSIQDLLNQNAKLGKEIDKLKAGKANEVKKELANKVEIINGVNTIIQKVDLDPAGIKNIAFALKNEVENLFLVLAAENNGKANLTILVSDKLSQEKDLHAGNIIRNLAKEINGGGGGQPFFASAGGSNPAGISSALQKAKELL